jgi:hypothetical protein
MKMASNGIIPLIDSLGQKSVAMAKRHAPCPRLSVNGRATAASGFARYLTMRETPDQHAAPPDRAKADSAWSRCIPCR